jgi:hypothetical protein
MIRWDLPEQRRLLQEERRKQALHEDFEFSGDEDSVVSDDGGTSLPPSVNVWIYFLPQRNMFDKRLEKHGGPMRGLCSQHYQERMQQR